jgi:hypothetical protein
VWLSPNYIDWDSGATIVNNTGFGSIFGIAGRRIGQALITTFLADNGFLIPQGLPVEVVTAGDIWLRNEGSTQAQQGMKAYASLTTGAFSFNWTGNPSTATTASSGTIAAGTAATFTGSISGNVLTTSGAITNTIYAGAVLTGGTVASGTVIVAQLTGTTGGAGTYAVSIPEQTVASASLTATPYVLTTGTMASGTVSVGYVVASTGGTATGTIANMPVTAAYGTGTWVVAPAPGQTSAGTATSGSIVLNANVETKWYAANSAAANELVKAFSQALG